MCLGIGNCAKPGFKTVSIRDTRTMPRTAFLTVRINQPLGNTSPLPRRLRWRLPRRSLQGSPRTLSARSTLCTSQEAARLRSQDSRPCSKVASKARQRWRSPKSGRRTHHSKLVLSVLSPWTWIIIRPSDCMWDLGRGSIKSVTSCSQA